MLSPDVRELTFDPGPGFAFTPGQWVSLRIPRPDDAEPLSRSYSIASWPRSDGGIDLAVTRVTEGPGSEYLHQITPGATLAMTHAQGFFTMPQPLPRPVLMVATGTGVAPLRSMLHAAFEQDNPHPITLLFGVRTEVDLLYRQEFEALARNHSLFRFEPTLSRPGDGWAGRSGYVQTHLADLTASLGPCDVYVCGLHAMINGVRKVLKDTLGFTRENIHTERYD